MSMVYKSFRVLMSQNVYQYISQYLLCILDYEHLKQNKKKRCWLSGFWCIFQTWSFRAYTHALPLQTTMSLTKEQCEEFWKIADKNGDGSLTVHELAAALKHYAPRNPPPGYKPPTNQDVVVRIWIYNPTAVYCAENGKNGFSPSKLHV